MYNNEGNQPFNNNLKINVTNRNLELKTAEDTPPYMTPLLAVRFGPQLGTPP